MSVISLMSPILVALVILALALSVKFIIPIVNLTSWKAYAVLAAAYLAVLTLSVFLLPLIPAENLAQSVTRSQNLTTHPPDPKVLFQLAAQWSPAQSKGVYARGIYQNSEQEFTLEGTTLHLKIVDNDYGNILIQRKDTDDGKIEVSSFVTTSNFVTTSKANGIDFTARLAPPSISLQNTTLLVQPGLKQNFSFKVLQASAVARQFQGASAGGAGNEPGYAGWSSEMGWKALYLVVPKDLKIDKGNYNVTIR